MNEIQRYERYKRKVRELEIENAKIQGELEAGRKQLRELGYKTEDEADKAMAKKDERIVELERQLQRKLDRFEDELDSD